MLFFHAEVYLHKLWDQQRNEEKKGDVKAPLMSERLSSDASSKLMD